MKNKLLLMLLLVPATSFAQQQPNKFSRDWYNANLHGANYKTSPAKLRGDTTYFLKGTRADTFDVAGIVPSSIDSTQEYRSGSDSLLFARVQLTNDPDSGWINYLADYFGYDSFNRDTSDIFQFWDDINSFWSNQQRTVNEYNGNDQLIKTTLYQWDVANNIWVNSNLALNDFDGSGNITQTVLFSWNAANLQWDSLTKFINVFDVNNNLTIQTIYISIGYSYLTPKTKETKTYNATNFEIQSKNQTWSNSQWKNLNRDTFEYDANNNLILQDRHNWHAGAYSQTYYQTIYEYNALNLLTQLTDYVGDGNVSYFPNDRSQFQYTTFDSIAFQLNQLYNVTDSAFVNHDQKYFWYSDVVSGVSAPLIKNYDLHLYPNPASQDLQLMIAAAHADVVEIQMLNVNGQMILSQSNIIHAGDNVLKLDVSQLPSGIYSLQVINQQTHSQSISRFVKQ